MVPNDAGTSQENAAAAALEAAITAVREMHALFFDNPGMKGWLESNEVAAMGRCITSQTI
jgi:hypothetical protein